MHMLAILSKALVIPGLVSNHGHVSLMATGTPWKRPLTIALALMYDMIMSNQAEEYVADLACPLSAQVAPARQRYPAGGLQAHKYLACKVQQRGELANKRAIAQQLSKSTVSKCLQ